MKRPQPDIGVILQQSFINNVGSIRKFKRLWGTTTVGGVEVLNHRQYYYPTSARSADFEKLFKFLGAYKAVTSASNKGISSAWLYINKNKGTDLGIDYHDFVADNLNQLWWDDADGPKPDNLTLTTTIVIEGLIDTSRTTTVATTDLLDPSTPPEQLAQQIETNYETLWDTCVISQQGVGVINKGSFTDEVTKVVTPDEDDLSPNDPWLDVIARYALRDNGIPCTIKDVEIGYGKTEAGRIYPTYVVTLEIPHHTFGPQAVLIEDIVRDLTADYTSRTRNKLSYPNGYYTRQGILAMDSSDLETDPDLITRPYQLWENLATEANALYGNLWINSGGTWYLKAEPFDNPRAYGLTFKKLNSYVMPLLDSGYQKKKVPWWKKAIAIIIFVVAVIYALPSGGTSLKAAAVATAILFGALVLTLFTLVLAATGNHEWASAFMEASKMIEPLVIVATIITMTAAIQKAAEKAAAEAAKQAGKEAAEMTLMDTAEQLISTAVDNMIESIIKGATDFMAGTVSNASMQFANTMIKLFMLPATLKIEDLNSRNKDLKAEYEELAKEMNQEYDVLQGFMYIYAKPATADWSMFAAEFDQPYERGGGPLSLGNIQRTTKQALRKADYVDYAFENILLM